MPTSAGTTRQFIADTTLLQTERKNDLPSWSWPVATAAVLSTNLLMVFMMGLISFRLGRIRRTGRTVDTPKGQLVVGAERALGRLGLMHPAQ